MVSECLPLFDHIRLTNDLNQTRESLESGYWIVKDQPLSSTPLSLETAQALSQQFGLPLFMKP